MSKTISFVMPCFNDSETIERAIKSIWDQDLPDIEMIVVNDGSTDNSKTILDSLKEQGFIDQLVHFEINKGACNARNEGAKLANGKYLSFLPADAILYPGMARIWYNTLEDFSEYDFLYGGYRFIDDEGEPLQNGDYLFHSFEPYLLETTNYIDGSFPIKKESYWKFAKIMNQPDGLWDPNIKSLQDWDFWLSVVKNGGKGIYVQDIFFGTTTPHKGGLSDVSSKNWLERIDAIKKKHNIPERRMCVASLGAGWHAKRIAYLLNADFKDMPSFKPHRYDSIYVIGFYPEFAVQQDQMFFNNLYDPSQGRTPAKKVVHFVGTDIWQLYNLSLRNLKIWQDYFNNYIDEILCEADFTQKELEELGIKAKIVPLPPFKLFEVRPLPQEFTVACYLPQINRDFYRPNEMIEIAKKMTDVKFKFFGNPLQVGKDPALPDNIEYMGYINDMDSFLSECSAIMRFPVHDGMPLSVLEFLLAGRYSIQSVPIKHTFFMPILDIDTAVKAINELKELAKQGVNQMAADYWRKELDQDVYKKTILEICGYNPKEYWEKRARAWTEQAKNMSIEVNEVKVVFEEAQKVIGKKDISVIDVGCGDGRWYPHLKEWGIKFYRGIDISENLVKAAQMRFPHEKDNFQAIKVEDLPKEENKFDLIFSYTCTQHIKPEDWNKAVVSLKKVGKKLILIEPTGFTSRYYCHDHPYRESFYVIKEVQLKDKVIFLCDLEK